MAIFTCKICDKVQLISNLRLVTELRWNMQICISCCPKKDALFQKDVLSRRYPNADIRLILEAMRESNSLKESEIYLRTKLISLRKIIT